MVGVGEDNGRAVGVGRGGNDDPLVPLDGTMWQRCCCSGGSSRQGLGAGVALGVGVGGTGVGVEVGVGTAHDPARTMPLAASETVNAANVPASGMPCTRSARAAAATIETGARQLTQAALDRSRARDAEATRAALVRRASRMILVDSVSTTSSVGAPTRTTYDSVWRSRSAT